MKADGQTFHAMADIGDHHMACPVHPFCYLTLMTSVALTKPVVGKERGSLSGVVSHGVVWMTLQAFAGKLLGLLSQIALARLLLPQDFGHVALAYTVSSVGALLLQAGISEVLVRRQQQGRLLLSAAFWLSGLLGVASAVLTIIAAPILSRLYGEPAVKGLVYVLSANSLAVALASVPEAIMRMRLAFRFMAVLGFVANALTVMLSVALAWGTSLGAYAFVVPILTVSLFKLIVLWVNYPVRISLDWQYRRWSPLLNDGKLLFAFAVCSMITLQADYVILGLFANARDVGFYFFAFNLSTQTVQILGMNLAAVLFPTLARINTDRARQHRAYLSALRLLAFSGVPFCFIQAALADPIVRLLFGAKWLPAVPLLQVLSLGMAWLLFGWQAGALLKAQGRFSTLLRYGVVSVFVFVTLVTVAAWLGGVWAVAIAVLLSFALLAALCNVMALGYSVDTTRQLITIFIVPLVLSALAIAPSLILQKLWADDLQTILGSVLASLVILGTGGLLSVATYILLMMTFARGIYRELTIQVGSLLRNRRAL